MKLVWSGFCVAFSLYSAVPVPQLPWEKRTMRWALCFLPLVGALAGGLELLWFWLCRLWGADGLFYAVFAALLPVVVSGGIHLDGLADTCDALCSFGEREKRLQILKDPHIGAFGVLWLAAFLLSAAACFAQIYRTSELLPLALVGFFLARAEGGRKIVTLPCAKDSGLAYLFAEGSDRAAVAKTLFGEWVSCAAALMCWAVRRGSETACAAMLCLFAQALWSLWHKRLCMKVFGGITGDLAGFYISCAGLLALASAAVGGLII